MTVRRRTKVDSFLDAVLFILFYVKVLRISAEAGEGIELLWKTMGQFREVMAVSRERESVCRAGYMPCCISAC